MVWGRLGTQQTFNREKGLRERHGQYLDKGAAGLGTRAATSVERLGRDVVERARNALEAERGKIVSEPGLLHFTGREGAYTGIFAAWASGHTCESR